MKHYTKSGLLITSLVIATGFTGTAMAEKSWYLRPNIGFSSLSDQTVTATGVANVDGSAVFDADSGFLAGLGLGYRYNDRLSAELAWEYRTNDSAVNLAGDQRFEEGNYASNTFFLNAVYTFDKSNIWKPYLGAGLSWIQEIDIDLEDGADELSYSSNGDLGFQIFAGLGYQLSDQWQLQAELRYGQVAGIELDPENNAAGQFSDVDYNPTTFQLGLVYDF